MEAAEEAAATAIAQLSGAIAGSMSRWMIGSSSRVNRTSNRSTLTLKRST